MRSRACLFSSRLRVVIFRDIGGCRASYVFFIFKKAFANDYLLVILDYDLSCLFVCFVIVNITLALEISDIILDGVEIISLEIITLSIAKLKVKLNLSKNYAHVCFVR